MNEHESNHVETDRSYSGDEAERSARADDPPSRFLDSRGRSIELRLGRGLPESTTDSLVEMYHAFDATHRVHGLPPLERDTIRDWLGNLRQGLHAVARHDGGPVGHAVLVAEADTDVHELAVFVQSGYQHARIGTRTLERLFPEAEHRGIPAITLYVERSNEPALSLYRSFGFEGKRVGQGELEMTMEL